MKPFRTARGSNICYASIGHVKRSDTAERRVSVEVSHIHMLLRWCRTTAAKFWSKDNCIERQGTQLRESLARGCGILRIDYTIGFETWIRTSLLTKTDFKWQVHCAVNLREFMNDFVYRQSDSSAIFARHVPSGAAIKEIRRSASIISRYLLSCQSSKKILNAST